MAPAGHDLLNPADLQVELCRLLGVRARQLGLSPVQLSHPLHLDRTAISRLLDGQARGFSPERLLRYLVLLGHHVEIVVRQIHRRSSLRPGLIVRFE
ncbi:MAG: helix-turn-helix domain-containing protein [Phycisphaerae bacterium]|nr:helix-turn-helix domain-containing protein [Phycisphaerae bacterium]MDW8262296.1 XRE family transcriptional regulator [Phycisphaerales bacterium]